MGELLNNNRTWQVQGKNFKAELAVRDGKSVLLVAGEIDVYTYPTLSKAIDEVIADGQHDLVIDLGDVTFLDSGGISVLIRAHKATSKLSGSLEIVRVRGHAYRVLEITGLLGLLNIQQPDQGIAA